MAQEVKHLSVWGEGVVEGSPLWMQDVDQQAQLSLSSAVSYSSLHVPLLPSLHAQS